MTTATSIDPSSLAAGSDDDFISAASLCIELEALCAQAGSHHLMSYVGLASSELMGHGTLRPTVVRRIDVGSIDVGLDRLEETLTRLISTAVDLAVALRLHEAREILREGRRRTT